MKAWAIAAAVVCGGVARAQLECDVRWQLPAAGLVFGDAFGVTIERRWPQGATAEPFDPASLQPFAVADLQRESLVAGERLRGRLFAYAAGEVQLAPIDLRVQLRDGRAVATRCTPPPVSVRSSLADPAGDVEWPQVLAAPARPRVLPWLLALLAVVAGVFWWRRQGAPLPAADCGPPPPSAVARALAALEALALPDAGASVAEVEAFYARLADLVREHAGRGLPVAAATRTSEELQRGARAGAAELRACLSACDGVKFGALRPGPSAHAAARESALAFVHAEAG